MKKILSFLLALPLFAATISQQLTIQEALYPGDPTGTVTNTTAPSFTTRGGIARTNDPVTFGVPLTNGADGINSTSGLGITGASIGQFRVLSCWGGGTPTGTPATSCSASTNIKWVEVDTQASVSAGAVNTSYTLVNTGSGNFGGSGTIATDNGTTITVSTNGGTCGAGSAICFTILKASTDIIHQVQIGSTTVVSSGASAGLVLHGPSAGNSACGTCTTVYASTNDTSSTATIEENGPAKAVIRITGTMKDGSGNPYTTFVVRLYFYYGKQWVRVTNTILNGGYSATANLTSAFKGMAAYELKITPNISGTLNWKFGADPTACTSGVCSGTVSSTTNVYMYQGQSNFMTNGTVALPAAYTPDTGYLVRNGGSTTASGGTSAYPAGWGEIYNSSNVGMVVGSNQMAAYGPRSLEFDNGGADVRIGIFASENGNPTGGPGTGTSFYYQAWQERKMSDTFLEFFTSLPSSAANDFLSFELPLIGHAAYTWYNTTAALTTQNDWALVAPSVEDNFFATFAPQKPSFSASFTGRDLGTDGNSNYPILAYLYYSWEGGGGGNQIEFHWSELLNFIRRGWGGSYINAAQWYRFVACTSFPYLLGDQWSSHTGDIDQRGYPNLFTPTNAAQVYPGGWSGRWDFCGQEHCHAYGIFDYYYLTGDENVHDAISPVGTSTVGASAGALDLYSSSWSGLYGNKGGYINPRSVGVASSWAARAHNFLTSVGDSTDAAGVSTQGQNVYTKQVHPDLCVAVPGGTNPPGCIVGSADNYQAGVSRLRGMQQGTYQNVTTAEGSAICANASPYRIAGAFQQDILEGGLWELRNELGSGWTYYTEAFDLIYGTSQFELTEDYYQDGTGSWATQGARYYLAIDAANNVPRGCAATGNTFDYYTPTPNNGIETTVNRYYFQNLYNGSVSIWKDKFLTAYQRVLADGNVDDFNNYQFAQVLNVIANVGTAAPATSGQSLVLAKITSVTGTTTYSVNINVPPGATAYRLKCATSSALSLVENIGFDPGTNTWIGNPATQQNWWAATEVTGLPAPSGTTQTITVASSACGGQTNLTAANFMVKAWASLANNTWYTMQTHGVPIGNPGWTKQTWNPDLSKLIFWGNYHDANSEANNAVFAYDYELNNWMLMARTEPYHDEHFPESGHQDGFWLTYDTANHTHEGWCCGSGSSGFEGIYRTWLYDLGSQIGLEKQTFSTSGATVSPDRPAEPSSQFIPSYGAYTMMTGGRGVWNWNITSNTWTSQSPACTKAGGGACDADPGLLFSTATAYNSGDGCGYLFGGTTGAGNFLNGLYKLCYSASTWTWTQLQPTGTPPSGRGWAAIDIDTTNNVLLLFGGACAGQASSCGESSGTGIVTDLWAMNLASPAWTQLSPSGTTPSVYTAAPWEGMTYDPVHNIHILVSPPCNTGSCAFYADSPSFTASQNFAATYFYRYGGTGPSPGITLGASPGAVGGNIVSAVNPFVSEVQTGSRTTTTNGWAQKPMTSTGNSLLNISRSELSDPFNVGAQTPFPTSYVDSWNGSSWTTWTVTFSGSCGTGGLWHNSTIAYAGGVWWLGTYGTQGNNRLLFATQASGTSFSVNCAAPFAIESSSTGGAGGIQFTDVGGTAYAATFETPTANSPPSHNQIFVYSWSGSAWTLVGSGALNATGTAASPNYAIASDGTHPCVTWADYTVDNGDLITSGQAKVHLSCYISSAWTVQGGGIANVNANNYAIDPSLIYVSGTPYVAFTERTLAGNAQLWVRKVSAGAWATVGSGSINQDPNGNGWAFHPSIASDGTNLYVAWVEYQPPHAYVSGEPSEERAQGYVAKFTSSWALLGTAFNADALYGSVQRASLAYYNSQPVVAFNEQDWGSSTQQLYARAWNGSAFTPLSGSVTGGGSVRLGSGKVLGSAVAK